MSHSLTAADRLRARVAALGAPLCLGIDPHPDALPDGLSRDAAGIEAFARGLVEVAGPHAAAIKVNVAFFEAFGSAGWGALERLRADVPDELVFVADAKRADIGPSAERSAEALFGRLDADAVTVSPYLGEDGVEPFLAVPGRIVYVLTRTSNPSAGRFQDLAVDGEPLHQRVAAWAAERWPHDRIGLVVGATDATALGRLRAAVPGPAFLVPGVGSQGGDLAAAVAHCHGASLPGLISISRGIAGASSGDEWRAAASTAAQHWLALMRVAGATLAP